MGKTKSINVNYATPGPAMEQQEFEQMIKKADSGSFHSINEVKSKLAKWKAKYSK